MSARFLGFGLAVFLLLGCRRDGAEVASDGGPTIEIDGPVGEGQLAVQVRGCGRCHQGTAFGSGVLAGQDTPVPGTDAYGSNLTPDPDTGLDVQDAGTLARSVLNGMATDGGPLCPSMPAYADAGMDAGEALAIAAYLQSLVAVWHPVPASTCASGAPGDGG